MIPRHFIPIRNYASSYGKSIKTLQMSKCHDKKKGRKDRFIEHNGITYVDIHYPYSKEHYELIQEAKELYYNLMDIYPNLHSLAVDFSKEFGCDKQAAYERLIRFSFRNDSKKVVEVFKILLDRSKGDI